MSSLLQADFARLRARGIATTLAQPAVEQSEGEPAVEPLPESLEPAVDPEAADGWLKRLLRTS